MEPRRKSADSFGTFLEIVQGKSAPPSADQAVVQLLAALDGAGPLAVTELWTRSGLDLTAFAGALKTVKDGGFVTTAGTADAEVVEITPSGATVAALSRGGP